ncbi:MAG: hypothetical protein ABUS51_08360 [Acidobacteriota bacterium]
MAMNILEFAKMLSEATGCDVKGFQSFRERPEERQTMETILAEHGVRLDMERFLAGDVKPAGLVIAYLNHESEVPAVFEMSAEVSRNWRERAVAGTSLS